MEKRPNLHKSLKHKELTLRVKGMKKKINPVLYPEILLLSVLTLLFNMKGKV